MTHYIFVAGGVMSSVGKGAATASIAKILQNRGFTVSAVKIDPYINVDAGTMNPIEHGETFVTDDGTECDQDLGNYERFLNISLSTESSITTGRVYQSVIEKERNLEFNGRCVEVVPDIPNEVISRIEKVAKKDKVDFVVIEIGGTVGEYQNLLFLEAARMMKLRYPKRVLFTLVTYLPTIKTIGEMKTKPTQTSSRLLNESGIQADFILGRASVPLDQTRKRKISTFCSIDPKDVISAPDVDSIYEIPINFEKEGLGDRIIKKLKLRNKKRDGSEWEKLVNRIKDPKKKDIKIGIVGKYFESDGFSLTDSYISILEAIKHSSWANNRNPIIEWISSGKIEEDSKELAKLKSYDGIIVPGGFGVRGTEGKIKAIEYCRKNKIPFLGLCLGLQLAVIEFARNVCGIKDATSTEFDLKAKNPLIDLMEEQKEVMHKHKYGATMRLGAWNCKLNKGTISSKAYKTENISERHRHRYEVNNSYKDILTSKGLVIAGVNPEKELVEIIELKDHPFFVATQFHPELKSRPLSPHPLFNEFIKAASK
ncbi:MAG: CTP synthase [Candidatus Pacebacteria bacterium]|nr:CTP synthase [Candidatus Paceibacterota bacterium]MDD2757347.1 CTP synthase [Candidatus Paceibacterota bacterium]MDD4738148.1 CTP synthase [Candidatus Paceibacterota bacterium]